MLKNKAIKCFSECSQIYGRKEECKKIKDFLKSTNFILHITGIPGTGKTSVVKWALSSKPFLYLNYFNESEIVLKKNSPKIVVIDEFDKFFEEKKIECLKFLNLVRKSKTKLITISNDLKMGNVRFKPYDCTEIDQILTEKMNTEIGTEIMDQKCRSFLIKKYGKTGDLRALFKVIVAAISKKQSKSEMEQNTNAQVDECEFKASNNLLEISDFLSSEKLTEQGIHHQIVSSIKNDTLGSQESFKKYLIECEELSITPLPKTDFNIILEML